MKKLIFTMLFAVTAMLMVSAQEPIQLTKVVCGKQIDKMEMSTNKSQNQKPEAPLTHGLKHGSKQEKAKSIPPIKKDSPNYDDYEGETIRIYLDVTWDEDYYMPDAFCLFNGVNSIFVYIDVLEEKGSPAKGYVIVPADELPDGNYSAWARFYRPDWGEDICVINDVNLPTQATEDYPLVFNTDEIKYNIVFHPVLPNGEELKFDKVRNLDHEPWYEIVSEGNVSKVTGDTYLVHDDYEYTHNTMFGYSWVNEEEPWPSFWILGVNELSDKYKYFLTVNVETKTDEQLHINMNSVGTTYTDVRNGTDFRSLSLPIKHTPAYKGLQEGQPAAGYNVVNMVCGATDGFTEMRSPEPINQLLIWESKDCSKKTLMSAYTLAQFDYVYKYVDYWEEDGEIYEDVEYYPFGIFSPMAYMKGDEEVFVTTETYMENAGDSYGFYPNHERFSFTSDQIGCEIGNTAPIFNIFNRVLDFGENEYYNLISIYNCYGRLGEARTIDTFLAKQSATFNGQVVCSEEDNFEQWANEWGFEANEPGTLVYTFVDDNIEVDDIKGRNVTTMQVQWLGEDMTAPTLTMLMTRDANDVVTDRFESVEGAVIEVSASDDNSGYTDDGFEEIQGYAKVAVEYAPFGTQEWEELETEEISDLASYTFGSFYRASLEGVDRQSENGWYDLRITATDQAGNTQQQVISPAFHVEKIVSSLIPTSATLENTPATYYNLQGVQIAKPSSGLCIRKVGNTVEKVRF